MAKITRATQLIFGSNAQSSEITAFGTAKEASPTYTTNPATIQNSNYLDGWASAIESDKAPYEEDTNGLFNLITRQLAYLFQQGISEWDANTEYNASSFCTVVVNNKVKIMQSTGDNNIGNNPATDSVNWIDYLGDVTTTLSNKADVDLDNINASQTAINTIVGWSMPDYTNAIAISGTYTAPSVGWVTIAAANVGVGGIYALVNNIPVARGDYASNGTWTGDLNCQIMVSKGDVITNLIGSPFHSYFIPCKGVN